MEKAGIERCEVVVRFEGLGRREEKSEMVFVKGNRW